MDEAHKARLEELEGFEKAGTLDENGVTELKGLREYAASLEAPVNAPNPDAPENPDEPKADKGASFGDLKKEYKALTGKFPKVGITKVDLAKAVEELKANPPTTPEAPAAEPAADTSVEGIPDKVEGAEAPAETPIA